MVWNDLFFEYPQFNAFALQPNWNRLDDFKKEYFDNLKEQIRVKKEKRLKNINKWNPSRKKKKWVIYQKVQMS